MALWRGVERWQGKDVVLAFVPAGPEASGAHSND